MISSTCVAYRRCILAGSRPGGRGTLVSAKAPKAICASARKSQPVLCAPCRLRGSGQGPSLSLARTHEIPLVPSPAQLRFLRFTVLCRSKDRGSPSVANPLAGAGIHWIPAFYPTRPSALGSATGTQQKPTPIPLLLAPAQTAVGWFCFALEPPYSSRGRVSLGTFLSRQESTSPSDARTRLEYSPVRRQQLLR